MCSSDLIDTSRWRTHSKDHTAADAPAPEHAHVSSYPEMPEDEDDYSETH